jgi:(2R)-sulfolactate sulfo-lyase subunit alpha
VAHATSPQSPGKVAFLVHREGDAVGVAVRDTASGDDAMAAYLDTEERFGIKLREDIPLGHKVALRELGEGEAVTEYGVVIGQTRRRVAAGELVHIHNLRSARWQSSV